MSAPARIVWLAFCSGPVLKREAHTVFPPSDLWKPLVPASFFRDSTKLFQSKFCMPRTLDLFTPDNQPVLHYRAVDSTNLLGWDFPLAFRLAQYRPACDPETHTCSTNRWELDFIARGKVTAIGPAKRTPAELEATRQGAVERIRKLKSEPAWAAVEEAVRNKIHIEEGFTSPLAASFILPMHHQNGAWAVLAPSEYPFPTYPPPGLTASSPLLTVARS
jgi:hypothetical protein